MKFLIPLGLLGLISIPVLILIYILRPNYRPQPVSSTFIWKLSRKYMKNKHHMQWIRNSLLFLLQTLVLLSLTLMLARPYISALKMSDEKIIIVDLSASMQAETGGTTRFERAVRDIRLKTMNAGKRHKVSVIAAGKEAYFALHRSTSPEEVGGALDRLVCTYDTADIGAAAELAKTVLQENAGAEVYLYTDRDYETPGYIHINNMSRGEVNAAVRNGEAKLRLGYYDFTADIISFGGDCTVPVSLVTDGEKKLTKTVELKQGEVCRVSFWNEPEVSVTRFGYAEICVQAEDGFVYDNTCAVFGQARPRYVELVSEYPHLLHMALLSDGSNSVFQAPLLPEPNIYKTGYDLYVYDGMIPDALPSDGALLLINPPSSCFGIELSAEKTEDATAQPAAEGKTGERLCAGIEDMSVALTKYSAVTSYDPMYEPVLTCEGYPVMLAGVTEDGICVVVLTFDLHYSTLPLLLEYPVLIHNICEYGAPPVSDRSGFEVGETACLSAKPNAEKITLNYRGMGNAAAFTEEYDKITVSPVMERPGAYTVVQSLPGNKTRTDSLYVYTAQEESDFSARGGVLAEESYGGSGADEAEEDTVAMTVTVLALALMVLLTAEWGVQSHEYL